MNQVRSRWIDSPIKIGRSTALEIIEHRRLKMIAVSDRVSLNGSPAVLMSMIVPGIEDIIDFAHIMNQFADQIDGRFLAQNHCVVWEPPCEEAPRGAFMFYRSMTFEEREQYDKDQVKLVN